MAFMKIVGAIANALLEQDEPPKRYKQQADTFCLQISHTKRATTFTLKDYTNFALYEKTYTELDYGREINRKAELSEICKYFREADQTTTTGRREPRYIGEYRFGEVVVERRKKRYKIENGGVLTLYSSISTGGNKYDEVESVLKLNKIKDLTFLEVTRQRQIVDDRVEQSAPPAEKKKKPDSAGNIKQFKSEITEELQNFKLMIEYQMQSMFEEHAEKIKKIQKQNKTLKEQIERLKWPIVHRSTMHAAEFAIKDSRITKKSNGKWHNILFADYVPSEPYSFKIKVLATEARNIHVGIMKTYNSEVAEKAIWYSGSGIVHPESRRQGDGFHEGQVVEVRVDRSWQKVEWYVNGKLKATTNNEMILESHAVFVPFVAIYNAKDSIQWLGSSYE